MIELLIAIILIELAIYLGVKCIYWLDYTNAYIHCHKPTEPCYDKVKVVEYCCHKGKLCDEDDNL